MCFLDANGCHQRLEESGFIKKYWLAHKINHGHFKQVNTVFTKDYKISARRQIFKGEELFLDSNRNILCSNFNKENCFSENSLNVETVVLLLVHMVTAGKLD
jgi:hypothetical protein